MLFLLIWFISVQLILAIAVPALGQVFEFESAAVYASPWFLIGVQLVVLMLPLLLWLKIKRDKFAPNMPNWSLGTKNIILIVALSFLLQPVMMTISGISSLFFTNYVSETMYSLMNYPLWLILLAMAVTPAVCEELVFRGYIQSQHRDRSLKQAALLNGLFFAIIHLSMQQFAYAFIMGIVFFVMVHYTRSIWAGILPHFIVNASQGMLARWAFSSLDEGAAQDAAYAAEQFENLFPGISLDVLAIIIIGVFALCLSPVIIILFREFIKHNRQRIAAAEWQTARTEGYVSDENNQAPSGNANISSFDADNMSEQVNNFGVSTSSDGDGFIVGSDSTLQIYPQEKPPLIGGYTIAIVVVFVLFQLLMHVLPAMLYSLGQ